MLHRAADDGQLCDSFTKHYYTNGQRIATRVNGDSYYFFSDHLSSTTVVADA